ncbi:MAG: IS3 family transposase [Gammaproteobacteria bacterium]|nr:IS3 family transposase [Gammaproteobacteria bacterium]
MVSRALDAQQDVLDYTSMLYNIKRLHSYLDYMSPNGYKRQLMERRKAA